MGSKRWGKDTTFQQVWKLLWDSDVHQPCLLISTSVVHVNSVCQVLETLGVVSWDGHSHLMSRLLHSSCLISPARSLVQLNVSSQTLYSSWRCLQSWLQCYFSPLWNLPALPRHSWVMMPRTRTPTLGLHSHPEQLLSSLPGINAWISFLSTSLISNSPVPMSLQ